MNRNASDGRLKPGVAIGLAGLALILLFLSARSCSIVPFRPDHFGGLGLGSGWFWPAHGLIGVWGLIQLGLAVWVGMDASRRSANGFLWGLLVFFTGVVGLIVYLIVMPTLGQRGDGDAGVTSAGPGSASFVPAERGPSAPARCRECGSEVRADFKVCPVCGASLRCRECDRALQDNWRVCPYCATPVNRSGE